MKIVTGSNFPNVLIHLTVNKHAFIFKHMKDPGQGIRCKKEGDNIKYK